MSCLVAADAGSNNQVLFGEENTVKHDKDGAGTRNEEGNTIGERQENTERCGSKIREKADVRNGHRGCQQRCVGMGVEDEGRACNTGTRVVNNDALGWEIENTLCDGLLPFTAAHVVN